MPLNKDEEKILHQIESIINSISKKSTSLGKKNSVSSKNSTKTQNIEGFKNLALTSFAEYKRRGGKLSKPTFLKYKNSFLSETQKDKERVFVFFSDMQKAGLKFLDSNALIKFRDFDGFYFKERKDIAKEIFKEDISTSINYFSDLEITKGNNSLILKVIKITYHMKFKGKNEAWKKEKTFDKTKWTISQEEEKMLYSLDFNSVFVKLGYCRFFDIQNALMIYDYDRNKYEKRLEDHYLSSYNGLKTYENYKKEYYKDKPFSLEDYKKIMIEHLKNNDKKFEDKKPFFIIELDF